jgi:RNA recognition motif-containing protein
MSNINIYIGNLPIDFPEEELRQKFGTFGEVLSVRIMNDKYIGSGQRRAYAYVEMAERRDGETAIEGLNKKTFGGSIIEITEALPLSDKKKAGAYKGTISKWGKQKRRQRE